MGIVKYGEIAKYTGVDGINHFQGEILVMQNERDDMVTLKQSLYSNRSKIINRKVTVLVEKMMQGIIRQEKKLMEKKLLKMLHLRLLKISWNELNF